MQPIQNNISFTSRLITIFNDICILIYDMIISSGNRVIFTLNYIYEHRHCYGEIIRIIIICYTINTYSSQLIHNYSNCDNTINDISSDYIINMQDDPWISDIINGNKQMIFVRTSSKCNALRELINQTITIHNRTGIKPTGGLISNHIESYIRIIKNVMVIDVVSVNLLNDLISDYNNLCTVCDATSHGTDIFAHPLANRPAYCKFPKNNHIYDWFTNSSVIVVLKWLTQSQGLLVPFHDQSRCGQNLTPVDEYGYIITYQFRRSTNPKDQQPIFTNEILQVDGCFVKVRVHN